MLKNRSLALLVFLCLTLCACNIRSASLENSTLNTEEKPERLTVYLSASSHTFTSSTDDENSFTLHPSVYTMGTMRTGG